jgi:hypothetical protein
LVAGICEDVFAVAEETSRIVGHLGGRSANQSGADREAIGLETERVSFTYGTVTKDPSVMDCTTPTKGIVIDSMFVVATQHHVQTVTLLPVEEVAIALVRRNNVEG